MRPGKVVIENGQINVIEGLTRTKVKTSTI